MRTIFVSSTFKDMQAERDALRDICAPKINEEARRHGDEIDFCDLRWGINTSEMSEEASSLKVLDVCFNQIDRCQPPFLILTGYRYGWIPDRDIVANAAKAHRLYLEDLEKSVTALEIEYGVCHLKQPTLVYIRNIVDDDIPGIYDYEDAYHQKKLQELKNRILALGNTTVHEYTVHMKDGVPCAEDIRSFALQVTEHLKAVMAKDWQAYDQMSPFERLLRAHWDYVQEKENLFSARQKDAEECLAILKNTDRQVVICAGDSGSGKSTLLSYLAMALKKERHHVLPIACGLTPEATDAYHITEMIIADLCLLAREKSDLAGSMPVSELLQKYRDVLGKVPADGNVYVLIDAVDQLFPDENRSRMIFIPKRIPANVKFFITCTKDIKTDYLSSLVLEDMSEQDQLRVIDGYLDHIRKELHGSVKQGILHNSSAVLPLSISLMVQRLCIMDVTDFDVINSSSLEPNAAIADRQITLINEMPADLPSLSEYVFEEVGRRINQLFCEKVRKYLAVSRFGLRVSDLIRLCKGNWSTLDFAHYINYLNTDFIVRTDGRYDFMHKSLREGILQNTDFAQYNDEICAYLKTLSLEDPLKRSEYAWHLLKARKYEDLAVFLEECDKARNYPLYRSVAENFHYQIIREGTEAVSGLIRYAQENDSYKYACLNFVLYYLPMHFEENREQSELVCDILEKTYDLLQAKFDSLPQTHQRAYIMKLCDQAIRYTPHDIPLKRKYAMIRLDYCRKNINQTDFKDREILFDAYYQAIWSLKNDKDKKILSEALKLAEECDRLLEEQAFCDYLIEKNNTLYSNYYGSMGEVYLRMDDPIKWEEMYKRDLGLRQKMYDRNPSAYNHLLLAGSYMNMYSLLRGRSAQDKQEAFRYAEKAAKIYDSLDTGDDSQFMEWKARVYNDYAQLKMVSCDSLSPEERLDVTRRLLDSFAVCRTGYRKYGLSSFLREFSQIKEFIYINNLPAMFRIDQETWELFNDRIRAWTNEDVVALKQKQTAVNYRLRYETSELTARAYLLDGQNEKAETLIRQVLDEIEPAWRQNAYSELKEPVQILYKMLFEAAGMKKNVYDRLGENAKKSGSDAGFYSSLLKALQAADQSVADVANALPGKNRLVFVRDDPDRVKQAIQNAGMGLGLKEVIAWLDTTKKSLFKTVPGSIFILHKAFDSTYDYAKHLEYKNIREVQLVKKQLVFQMKNGKTITIDYDDPDGIVRGIVAGYQEKHRD